MGRRQREPLSIVAEWVPTEGAAKAWDEAIDLLADAFAELAIEDARRELQLEMESEREAADSGKPLGAVDRAMRATWFPRFVQERDRYSYRQHEARLGVPRWILRQALERAGHTKARHPGERSEPEDGRGRSSPAAPPPDSAPQGRHYDMIAARGDELRRFSATLHPDDTTPDGAAKAKALVEASGWEVLHLVQRRGPSDST